MPRQAHKGSTTNLRASVIADNIADARSRRRDVRHRDRCYDFTGVIEGQ